MESAVYHLRRVFVNFLVGFTVFFITGCSTVSDVWEGTTDAVGSLFSSDEYQEDEDASSDFPDLASVPDEAPETSDEERASATEGLIADTNQSQYTNQVRRSLPSAVRPLQSRSDSSLEPPPPEAAPSVPVGTAELTNRSVSSLADRLSDPPPPPVTSLDNNTSSLQPNNNGLGNTQDVISGLDNSNSVTLEDVMPISPRPLKDYSGSTYRVSTHVATVTFKAGSSRLDSKDQNLIDEVVDLQKKYGGAVRVTGHASSRTKNLDPVRHKLVNFRVSMSRANAVADALLSKGLPASNLYVGAMSDNEPLYYEVMPNGESGNQRAEIYLDY